MSTSMLLGMFDWISDFFKSLFDMIPKVMYLLYASLACIIDVLQLAFRKLAGLDVYYVDGNAVSGDLVYNFVRGILSLDDVQGKGPYPVLNTVFWSFIVFGLIMVFMTTIVAIVKSHYTYDDKAAKGPMQYVYTAGKAVINMIAVPIIVVLGLYLNQGILTAVDSITSTTSGDIATLYNNPETHLRSVKTKTGQDTYIYYDMFGAYSDILYGVVEMTGDATDETSDSDLGLIASSNQTFSGSLFRVAAFNANRARIGQMTVDSNFTGSSHDTNFPLFKATSDPEILAEQIDTAFACNLHMKKWQIFNYDYTSETIASSTYFTNFYAQSFSAFSKFNIGAVWYYYDLWNFNFIVAFAGCLICVSIFINVIFGLISRLFMCIVLFLIAPPLFGLAPLDGGEAGKKWRTNFIKQVLMTYGAVAGMNLMFLILPYINTIDFFNVPIADLLMQTLIIIAGLITIKAVIALISDLIGAADANKDGEGLAKETGKQALAGAKMTHKAAMMGVNAGIAAGKGAVGLGMLGAGAVGGIGSRVIAAHHNRAAKKAEKRIMGDERADKMERAIQAMSHAPGMLKDRAKFDQRMKDLGLSKKDSRKLWEQGQRMQNSGVMSEGSKKDFMGRSAYQQRADFLKAGLAEKDKGYAQYRRDYAGMTNIQKGRARADMQARLITESQDRLARSKSWRDRAGNSWRFAGQGVKTVGGAAKDSWKGRKIGKISLTGFNEMKGVAKDTYTSNSLFDAYNEDKKKAKDKSDKKNADQAEQAYRDNVLIGLGYKRGKSGKLYAPHEVIPKDDEP